MNDFPFHALFFGLAFIMALTALGFLVADCNPLPLWEVCK